MESIDIQQLQEEENKRNAHIQELDSELETQGKRILTLQEEQVERDAHIKELDSELEKNGELIRNYQKEEEQRNIHIKTLDGQIEELNKITNSLNDKIEEKDREIQDYQKENQKLAESNKLLENICSQTKNERDYMEEQRNALAKERDELKVYHRDLTEECTTLKSKVEELQTELKNKQGHIDLLLESDRELQQIHHSRSWKILSVWWRFRDFLIPPNSKRRLILKLIGKFVRHPIWCIKRVDRDHIRKFTDGVKNGSIMSTSQRLDNYLGGGTESTEKPDQFPLVEYARIDDVPKLHVPSSNHPDVSIIIPVYNQFSYTYNCLKSIAKNSGEINYEVIIADDRSSDLTEHIKKAVSGIKVIRNKENLRFLLNCNNATKSAKGKYILFLNNDTQVMEGWLQPLVELIERNDKIGMVGSKLIYPDGRLQEAGGILWNDGSAWNYGHLDDPTKPEYNYVKEADYISGAAIMIRADLWKQLGGFDERFAPAYCEDSDLAFQVRAAGYKVMFQPKSVVIHFEGISNGTDTNSGQKSYQVINSQKFHDKWKDVLEKEHNPNGVNAFLAKDRSLQKHTLLFVDHYVPQYDKDAGSRTVFAYLKMFVHAGYNIKFIGDNFFPHQPYTEVLQQLGIEVLYGNWYGQHWKEWLIENGDCFDYAFLNRPHIAVKYIDIVREKTNAKILYYGHDLHFLRFYREYEVTGNKRLINDAEDWKEKEFSLMRKSDITAYPSVVEVEEIKKIDPNIHAIAIPAYIFDSVDETEYLLSQRKDLFFIGGYVHGPNIDAVKWFISEILPIVLKVIPQIRIHLAGSNMPQELIDLASENVIIEGMITDEQLEEFYHSMRLNIVPLRYGAGIKGKIIESMRYGLPVITTPCGAEGIQGAESILAIGNNAEEIAAWIIALYDDEEKLSKISKEGKQYVLDHYSEHGAIEVMSKEFDLE